MQNLNKFLQTARSKADGASKLLRVQRAARAVYDSIAFQIVSALLIMAVGLPSDPRSLDLPAPLCPANQSWRPPAAAATTSDILASGVLFIIAPSSCRIQAVTAASAERHASVQRRPPADTQSDAHTHARVYTASPALLGRTSRSALPRPRPTRPATPAQTPSVALRRQSLPSPARPSPPPPPFVVAVLRRAAPPPRAEPVRAAGGPGLHLRARAQRAQPWELQLRRDRRDALAGGARPHGPAGPPGAAAALQPRAPHLRQAQVGRHRVA